MKARQITIKNDYIYGQGNPPYSCLRIGKWGNGKAHGCGPFAVYNALLVLRDTKNPVRIIRHIKDARGFVFGGYFGTKPKAMMKYIQACGYKAQIFYLPFDIERRIKDADVSILQYIWRRKFKIGIHYITVRYQDGEYFVYNQYSNDIKPRRYLRIKGRFTVLGLIRVWK